MSSSPQDAERAQHADMARLDDLTRTVGTGSDVQRRRHAVDGAIAILETAAGQRPRLMPMVANTLFTLASLCAEPQRERLLICLAHDTGLSLDALRVFARREEAIAQAVRTTLTADEMHTLVASAPPFTTPFRNMSGPVPPPARSSAGVTPAGWFLFTDLAQGGIEDALKPAPDQWTVTRNLWRRPELRAALVVYGTKVLFADGTAAWGDPAIVAEAVDVLQDVYPHLRKSLNVQMALRAWLLRVAAIAPLAPWIALVASVYALDVDEAWNLVRQRRMAYPDAVWPVEVWTPWLQHENAVIRMEAVTLVAWPLTHDALAPTTERARTR